MSKTRGVTLKDRNTPSGPRFDVRWRERTDSGKWQQYFRRFTDKSQAEALVAELEIRLKIVRVGRSMVAHTFKRPGVLADLIPIYVASEIKSNDRHQQAYRRDCLRLMANSLDRKPLWKMTTDITHAELKSLIRSFGQKKTRAHAAGIQWKHFLTWCSDTYLVADDFHKFKTKQPKGNRYYAWTETERLEILKALRHQHPVDAGRLRSASREYKLKRLHSSDNRRHAAFYPMFWLEVHWGPRPSEAALLDVGDWDSKNRHLFLRAEITKNGNARDFIVDPETAALLDRAAGDRPKDQPLFLSVRKRRWSTRTQEKAINPILRSLGIRGKLYSARHHACTMLCSMMKGLLDKVMSITGHLTMSEFKRYLHDLDDLDLAARRWEGRLAALAVPHGSQLPEVVGLDVDRGEAARLWAVRLVPETPDHTVGASEVG